MNMCCRLKKGKSKFYLYIDTQGEKRNYKQHVVQAKSKHCRHVSQTAAATAAAVSKSLTAIYVCTRKSTVEVTQEQSNE